MVCRASWHMPWARTTRNAYRVCAHEVIKSRTWSDADKPFVIVTPKILINVIRIISAIGSGSAIWRLHLQSVKTISCDFFRFSVRLFFRAHVSMLFILAAHYWLGRWGRCHLRICTADCQELPPSDHSHRRHTQPVQCQNLGWCYSSDILQCRHLAMVKVNSTM